MKPWKKILIAGGILLAVFVTALAAAPLLFEDRIEARVKGAIHDRVDARVEFGDVGLNLFRHFPNLAFSLRDLTVTGMGAFEGDTLAHVDRFRLVVDLGSAVRAVRRDDALVVRSIHVDRPYLHARVLEDGRASWDIMKAATEAAEVVGAEAAEADSAGAAERGGAAGVRVALRRLAVSDGRIALDDARSGLHARVDGLDHELAGDFTAERFTLRTRTGADRVTLRHAGVPYLTDARVAATADLDADMVARRFTFRENRLALNELGLGLDGTAALVDGGGMDLDLTFAADRADFRHVLSLVPALYLKDFQDLRAAGSVAVRGHVKGRQGPAGVPSFRLDVDVDDGMFQYADLPLPVRGIFVDLGIGNPGGDLDRTTVALSRFDLSIGDDPFSATAALATPVSDPEVDLSLKGRIDLGALSRAVKLDGIDELRGTVTTDAAMRARRSWVEARDFARAEARGQLEARDVAVRGEALPHPVAIDELRLELSPRHAEMAALSGRAGSSDFRATGRLDNLLGFALWGEELRGRATVASRFVDLDEWRSESEDGLQVIPVPPNLDLVLAATVDSMELGALAMSDARGEVRVKDRRATLDGFALRTLGGEMVMSGWYETTDPARPAVDFELAMAGLDIPGAFTAFNTVRTLAPAAAYATGRFSADLRMSGALGPDMMPLLDILNGRGAVRTQGIAVQGMPALHRLAETVRVERLRDPVLSDFASSIEIRDGRLHVRPFDLRVGDGRMHVAGSNGIDQSIEYELGLELPRDLLGDDAERVVSGLLAEAGRVGVDLASDDVVRLGAVLGGTVASPTLRLNAGDALASAGATARDQVETRLRDEADRRVEDAERRAEEARQQAEADARARAEEARARARAEADAIMKDAETRAARIRTEAAQLAESVRKEGYEKADRLEAEATNPLAQRAAKVAADRVRREADEKADGIIAEAARRAEAVLAEARERIGG